MITDTTHAVYCLRTHRFIDLVSDRATAETALAQFMPEYGPNLVVLDYPDAVACHDAALRTSPEEITAAKWQEMLEILPPLDRRTTTDAHSFKLVDPLSGSITSIYVALGERYFTFNDNMDLPHAACCARVRASAAFATPCNDGAAPEDDGRGFGADDNVHGR